MSKAWTVQQVETVAPDAKSVQAGRKLAVPGPWSELGVHGELLWGSCRGSGRNPYRVSVDTRAPAYKCSCPSRKFPCKHAIALLLLWSDAQVPETDQVAEFAAEWAAARSERATRTAEPREQSSEQQAAAAARAAKREERVSRGLSDLELFLSDQVREGLAKQTADRPHRLEQLAARMVDAQAGGVANLLRDLAVSPAASRLPEQLLDEYALLHLLARAWKAGDALPADLAATVRSRIGFAVQSQEVLATEATRDRWVVVGMQDGEEGRIGVRRVWLQGRESGIRALLLFYFQQGVLPETNLHPSHEVDADLHFYPGRPRLRAIIGNNHGEQQDLTGWAFTGTDIATASAELRQAVAADPWLDAWPVAITGTVTRHSDEFWLVADTAVPLVGGQLDLWQLFAELGCTATTLFGELSAAGFRPFSYLANGRINAL